MEEEKKTPDTVGESDSPAEASKDNEKGFGNPRLNYIIRVAAGAYLLYTTYGLYQGIKSGENSSPWIIVAGIAFAVFGVLFLYSGLKGYLREDKLAKEEAARLEQEEEEEEAQETPAEKPKKGLSITERANLAKRLDDVAEDQVNEEE